LSTAGALFLAMMLASGAQAKAEDNTCEKSITWLEARGESTRGVAAVRQVIRNRSRRSGVGTCKIVKRKGQFSSYRRGMRLSHVRYDKKFLTKWEDSSTMHVLSSEYTYYFRKDIQPEWARRLRCDRVVDHHRFCRDN
jgi:spore germination cell wall hydrolase CwlJ-like protein